jgi:hypothetical protein
LIEEATNLYSEAPTALSIAAFSQLKLSIAVKSVPVFNINVMLLVIMLNVVMVRAVRLNDVAPLRIGKDRTIGY